MTVQPHDYATSPFGAHDASEAPVIDHIEDHALARLEGVGFTAGQAAAFVAEKGSSTVRSASESALKKHLAVLNAGSDVFDPADHKVDEVIAHVGDDPVKAAAAAAAERQAKKPRKTLLEQLDALAAPADDGLGNSSEDGAASSGEDAPDAD